MQREIRVVVASVVLILAFSASDVFAQQPADKCSQVEYSGRLTNAYPYRLKSIEGQAVYGEVSEKGELQPASGICVNLFDQKEKRFVTSLPTETGGQFNFAKVAPGKYVLNVSVSALHHITVPVEVAIGPKSKAFRRWGLLLHLRARDDRKKSFVTPMTQPALREELVKMLAEDQAVRHEIIQNGADVSVKAIEARAAVIDAHTTARMKAIVRRYGWPGPELVGADGAEAAFLLVQHSPDLAFQQSMLPLVRRSYERGKLSAWNYALLLDRVLAFGGKPQIYGMQLKPWTGKEPELYPLVDAANVDKRRAKIGLPPLREYLEFVKRMYFQSP